MGAAKDAIDVVKGIGDLAKDSPDMRDAGTSLARSARIVARSLENVLLPLAIANAGLSRARAYFEQKFGDELHAKIDSIPEERLTDPPLTIAGPAIQALTFSFEDDDLRDMYLELLARAMDTASNSRVHPAFVEVIRQLAPREASLLKEVLKRSPLAIAKIRRVSEDQSGFDVVTHFLDLEWTEEVYDLPTIATWVDNWIRLGLVDVRYDAYLTDLTAYEYVTSSPIYDQVEQRYAGVDDKRRSAVDKGALSISSFGAHFASTAFPKEGNLTES